MITEETRGLLTRGNELLEGLEKIGKFSSKYGVKPTEESRRIIKEIEQVVEQLDDTMAPANENQLFQSELRRRLNGEASFLEQQLSGRFYNFETITNIYGIPSEDLQSLLPWLQQNREQVIEIVGRLFASRELKGYELPVALDIPGIRRQAEEVGGGRVRDYHRILRGFLSGLTKVGSLLNEIEAHATQGRSYFNQHGDYFAFDLEAICSSGKGGSPFVKEDQVIRLYGHEVMGHALNFVTTRQSGLPEFLKRDSALTVATEESVAQFYEAILINDLKRSPKTQRELGIEHVFDRIYGEMVDTEKLEEYKRRLFQYTITVLADKSFGAPTDPETIRKKAEVIESVSINPGNSLAIVDRHKYHFDSEMNLSPNLVTELRYCARPVQRALQEFKNRGVHYDSSGRQIIDPVLLTGFWTPKGYVDNARIQAKENKTV